MAAMTVRLYSRIVVSVSVGVNSAEVKLDYEHTDGRVE